MENKKIYEALNTIKDCCKEHDKECEKCPLSVTENGFHKCKVGDTYNLMLGHSNQFIKVCFIRYIPFTGRFVKTLYPNRTYSAFNG